MDEIECKAVSFDSHYLAISKEGRFLEKGHEIFLFNLESGEQLANLSNPEILKPNDSSRQLEDYRLSHVERSAMIFTFDQKLICIGRLHYFKSMPRQKYSSEFGSYQRYFGGRLREEIYFIEFWDLTTLKLLQYLTCDLYIKIGRYLELSSDNTMVTFRNSKPGEGSDDYFLNLWRLNQPFSKRLIGKTSSGGFFSKFSPSNQTIFVDGLHLIQIWDVDSFTCVRTIAFNGIIPTIALTAGQICPGQKPDEDLLAVGDVNGMISFWGVSRTTLATRFLTMPGPQPDAVSSLDASETKLKGCRMSKKSQKLLQQAGADVSEVKIVEKKSQRPKTTPSYSETMPITLLGAGDKSKNNPSESSTLVLLP